MTSIPLIDSQGRKRADRHKLSATEATAFILFIFFFNLELSCDMQYVFSFLPPLSFELV